jgi:hypothetical protein
MANKKITEFVTAAAVGSSVVPVSDAAGTVTNKVTLADIAALGGGAPADGSVATAKLANSAVTYAKLQNVSATDRLLGRATTGAGVVEEIPCTVFGRSLLAATTAAAAKTTLALAAVATSGSYTDLTNAPDSLLKTGGTITGNLFVNGAVIGSGARSAFAANNEQYALGARYAPAGGVVYFGATNATTTPDIAISNSGGATLMLLQTGGNVGIGTNTPTQRLDVNGNITAIKSLAPFDVSARSYVREWIELPNYTGLLSANNSAYFRPNDGAYGGWKFSGTRNGWAGIEFSESSTSLMQGLDGNMTGFHRNGYGWQFYWQTGELRCFKNQFGGGTNATVLDSVNYVNYLANGNTNTMGGRLTLTSNTPVAYADATGSTIYYTPHTSNYISLYDTVAARWVMYPFTEVSLSVATLAANVNYDVFIRRDGATGFALETLAWPSDTDRTANSLTLTASRAYVRASDNSQRYIGTIRTSALGVVSDTNSLRYVWSMDNRVQRLARANDSAAHTYAGANGVYRPWRNLSAASALGLSRVQFITGMAEEYVRADWYANTMTFGGAGLSPALDSRTAPVGLLYAGVPGPTSQVQLAASANVTWNPLLGYHFVEILQGTPTGASGTYYGVAFNVAILS